MILPAYTQCICLPNKRLLSKVTVKSGQAHQVRIDNQSVVSLPALLLVPNVTTSPYSCPHRCPCSLLQNRLKSLPLQTNHTDHFLYPLLSIHKKNRSIRWKNKDSQPPPVAAIPAKNRPKNRPKNRLKTLLRLHQLQLNQGRSHHQTRKPARVKEASPSCI